MNVIHLRTEVRTTFGIVNGIDLKEHRSVLTDGQPVVLLDEFSAEGFQRLYERLSKVYVELVTEQAQKQAKPPESQEVT